MELDREDFRLWLAAKEPDELVWLYPPSAGCPISRYMTDRTGTTWLTDCEGTAMSDDDHLIGAEWSGDFVSAVDDIAYGCDRLDAPHVTAKEALTVLDGLDV